MNAVSREARRLRVAALREAYAKELADGTAVFFAERATACPWCASPRIRGHLRTTDLFQHKPGHFTLDRCEDCGHVFQNPRLNDRGLAFYYRDFYDGLGEEQLGSLFAGRTASYRSRAASVKPHLTGRAEWLDVGTGTDTSATVPPPCSRRSPSTGWTAPTERSSRKAPAACAAATGARSPNWPGVSPAPTTS